MVLAEQWYFDDMNGKFQARLKGIRMETKSIMISKEFEATSVVAELEAKFDIEVFDRLHDPTFIAIERETKDEPVYLVYEVTSVKPMHFQMLGVTPAIPQQIREEFLDRVSKSWDGSQETWIDLGAVHTGYMMYLDGNELKFQKTRLTPLQGSIAHVLSRRAVESLICVENGMEIGKVKGLDISLTIDESSLLRYHIGVFGFTGTGKSNLTSLLVKKMMERDSRLKVCFLDVSGEYSVNMIDKLDDAVIYTDEEFDSIESFAQSQVIPDTLATLQGIEEKVKRKFEELSRKERIRTMSVEEEGTDYSLSRIYEALDAIAGERKTGSIAVENSLNKILQHFDNAKIRSETLLKDISEDDKNYLKAELSSLLSKVHEKSGAYKDIESLIELLDNSQNLQETEYETPEKIARSFLRGKERMMIMYLPEPSKAQEAAARFLRTLLYLKKVQGNREKVLVVLDEAQEFASSEPRGSQSESSKAVEALLRQGRKYNASAIITTQRVAYLNTNALQQLHSYFVSTLPRTYDRVVIADAFSLDLGVLQKTTELQTGEWLFVSYKATKQKNIPVFITAENNEDRIRNYLAG